MSKTCQIQVTVTGVEDEEKLAEDLGRVKLVLSSHGEVSMSNMRTTSQVKVGSVDAARAVAEAGAFADRAAAAAQKVVEAGTIPRREPKKASIEKLRQLRKEAADRRAANTRKG